MDFPPPTQKQARIIWFCLTALAVGVFLAVVGFCAYGIGMVVQQLSSVLLPLAIAAIIAFILDPLVDRFERWGIPRVRALVLVFAVAVTVVIAFMAMVLPPLVLQVVELVSNIPDYLKDFNLKVQDWTTGEGWIKAMVDKLPENWKPDDVWQRYGDVVQSWVTDRVIPFVSNWTMEQARGATSWLGLLIGFFLVPVYVFYFLLEKKMISRSWTDYLPIAESRVKEELVFILSSINDSLIVFFRGQVLVALCVGSLTAVGFMVIGLKYGLLLGAMTGILGIIPYLGVMASIIPALILGVIQFHDWRVLLVAGVFVLVQSAEGWVISPKIIGDRVGMHPLTIIIAIMVGTTLMGGIVGGVLAIPLTAVIRTLMFRYVWVKPKPAPSKLEA